MSPRGESATPGKPNSNNGAAPAAPRKPLGPTTINTHHHNNNLQQQVLGQKSYKGYNTAAAFKPLFAGGAPTTTNNTAVAPRTIPPSTPPRFLPSRKQQCTSPGNDGGGSLLKSPQSSNYACLYERYKDITAPPYYPPPSPAKRMTPNLQAHHPVNKCNPYSSGAPSILLKASKYVNLDTPGGGGGAHPSSSASYITELPRDHDADYSTGQSTTFSSRASSTSTRCDWNTSSSNNMAQHGHVEDAGVCQYRGEQQQQSRYIHEYPPTPTPSYYATGTTTPALPTTTTGHNMPSYSSSTHHHHPTATILAPPYHPHPSSQQGRRMFVGHGEGGVGGVGLPQMLVESLVAGEGARKATTQPTSHQQQQQRATATSTASHHNQAALMELAGVGEVVALAAAPPVMIEPFVSRPVWSLVGTFKTVLQTALDARKGNALRWTQANPNGGRQKITIPFVNIAASEQIRVQMEDLQQQSYDDEEVKKGRRRGSRSRSVSVDSSSHHGAPSSVIGVKRSRSETASFAKQDQLLARLPHFGGRRSSNSDATNSNSNGFPPATQPHRMAPRPVSMMSHAVVIKTRNMRPSQVTFGFNSSIEAALFNTKIRNIQRASKEYIL